MLECCKCLVQYNYCLYAYRSYHESITRKIMSRRQIDKLSYTLDESSVERFLDVVEHRREYILYKSRLVRILDKTGDRLTDSTKRRLLSAIELGKANKIKRIYCYIKKCVTRAIVSFKIFIKYEYKLKD